MAIASSNQGQQQTGTSANQPQKSHLMRYILYAVIAIIVIIVVVVLVVPTGPSITITQTASKNSTSIYMSPALVQSLLGSQLSNYTTGDMFNPNSPINVSDFVSLVPLLYGNVTSGWMTIAQGSNTTLNASLEYMVVTTNNTQKMFRFIRSNFTASVGATPNYSTTGVQDGMNYTYDLYTNSTSSFQTVYGWKGSNVAILFVAAKPAYTVNRTKTIDLIANVTPYN